VVRPLLRVVVVLALSSWVGCGAGSHPPPDGGPVSSDGGASLDAADGDASPRDAGDAGDAATEEGGALCTASPMSTGCPCSTESEGVTICNGGNGTQCCGGRWQEFLDGPCWALDAGAGTPTCERDEPGCPCSTDGESMCRSYRWDLLCVDGTWAERVGHACCSGGA
jgi:hypothetical protein